MTRSRPTLAALATVLALAACASPQPIEPEAIAASRAVSLFPNETPELRALIEKYADHYGVPESLVHRVAIRESRHRPGARNGPYMGLMQIHPATARGMGYRGPAEGLLDADTNLRYAVKYLRGAWLVADGDEARAVQWYARGYYHEAKRKGLLDETGLR